MTKDQEGMLLRYTDDLSAIHTMPHYDYFKADSKKVSKILEDYHVIWFHDDPGKMYLVKKEE